MAKTLSDLRDAVKKRIKNPNLSNSYVDSFLNEAISDVRADYKIQGARRKATIKIYPNVNEYALPIQTGETTTDFDSLIDLQEWFEGDNYNTSNFRRSSLKTFARKESSIADLISTHFVNGQKMLLVNFSPLNADEVLLHNCDAYDQNGTWTAVNDASNVTTDENTYVQGAGSINFDITPTATLSAGITVDGMASVDLDDYENFGAFFVLHYIPDATYIAGQPMTLRWGNSATVYWQATATTQHNGLAFQNGFNLIRFEWGGATETGAVNNIALDCLRFTLSYTAGQAADTDFRLDSITFREGTDLYLEYNSSRWVRSSAGIWQDEFSEATDYFVGTNDEAYLLVDKTVEKISETVDKDIDRVTLRRVSYERRLNNLRSVNPQEISTQGETYFGDLEDL